ncbi:MAG: phage portal protein [Acidimicrobiales bacterium]
MTVLGALLHKDNTTAVAGGLFFDPAVYGLEVLGGGDLIRLTDGPGGQPRYVSYGTIYRANPWLWAVVNTIARGVARLPLKLYRDMGETRERVLPGKTSAAARLAWALRYPGFKEAVSRRSLWYATVVDRLVRGNGLWQVHRDRDGVVGFQRHPWRWVVLDEDLMVYRVRIPAGRGGTTGEIRLLPEDVTHYGLWAGDDGPVNTSPIGSLKKTIALYDAVERHLTSFFEKGARPSGHLEVDKNTGDSAIKRIREELQNLYGAADNAGRVLVTSGKWTQITESPDNSKVIELAKQSREEICAAYGVPPPLVGILDRAIMSNVRELRDHYVRDTVGPHSELAEGDFEAQVIDRDPRLTGVFAEFDLAAQLRPDVEARAKAYRDMRFVYSLNELRRRENLPPVDHPDADVPWIPLNEAPIDQRPEEDEPAPPALPPGGDSEPDEAARSAVLDRAALDHYEELLTS